MPNDFRLRVGTKEATVPIGGTPAQVAAALKRYARSLGISTAGTDEEQMTAILEHIKDDVRRRSKEVQTADERALKEAEIQAKVDADNPL